MATQVSSFAAQRNMVRVILYEIYYNRVGESGIFYGEIHETKKKRFIFDDWLRTLTKHTRWLVFICVHKTRTPGNCEAIAQWKEKLSEKNTQPMIDLYLDV